MDPNHTSSNHATTSLDNLFVAELFEKLLNRDDWIGSTVAGCEE